MLIGTTANIFQGIKEKTCNCETFHREQKAIYGICFFSYVCFDCGIVLIGTAGGVAIRS